MAIAAAMTGPARDHLSAPEVVAAARARGSYVVDSVCPLVTKVHHEVKVRAKKGFRIVYVGHEGHDEAIGTLAVAHLLRETGVRGHQVQHRVDGRMVAAT